MTISLEPTWLDSPHGDNEAMLARRDGRLFAILSCLGDLHGELLGHWYVETTFSDELASYGQVFANLKQFEDHVERQSA